MYDNLRIFDVFSDFLLVVNDPFGPALAAIRHATQDDFGHLQAGFAQTDCQIVSLKLRIVGGTQTVGHLLLGRGRHCG